MSTSAPYHAARALGPLFPILLLTACLAVCGDDRSWAATVYGGKWQQLETRHAILLFESSEVLAGFDRQIRYRPGQDAARELRQASDGDGDSDIAGKIDALFMRVQEILDMRRKMARVTIKIYPDSATLQEVYQRLFPGENPMRAWYLFEKNTIYVSVADLHEGMLAHEMAHAIIDHFFAVRPPSSTAEILARYVGKHLDK